MIYRLALLVVRTGATLALILAPITLRSATFTWRNVSGGISDPTKWVEQIAPSGTDATDLLIFGGPVGTTAQPLAYTATSTGAVDPFLINQLRFTATNASPGTGPVQTIAGTTTLRLGGTGAGIEQAGTASISLTVPIDLGATVTFSGNTVANDTNRDKATVTLDGRVSGNFDIVKNGTSTFRFGSATGTSYSVNTWFGGLTINDGTIRFNNNAYAAPTALRANPVTLNGAGALLTTTFKPLGTLSSQDPDSSLRVGTLNGLSGTVSGQRQTTTTGNVDSVDLIITALDSGTFGGTISNTFAGTGSDAGKLGVRGVATQTLTGTLAIAKDIEVGHGAGLTLAGAATLSGQTSGAIILNGGTFTLDNGASNNGDRLRNASASSTGLETIGGGTFTFLGNAAGSAETLGRLQLGSSGNSRSGALTIKVIHTAGLAAATVLSMQSYSRDAAGLPYDTVNFSATNAAGAALALGTAGSAPRILFASAPPLFNGLLGNTGTGADATSVGWATVTTAAGTDFASYGANGITAATTSAAPAGNGIGDATLNAALGGNFSINGSGAYALNSLKLMPAASGQALDLAGASNLATNAFLLSGTTDYTINSSGGGAIANAGGTATRYFHVPDAMLTVNASLNGANAAVVKSGAGTLVLTSAGNVAVSQPTVLNEGTLRATPGVSLPGGELRLRGGVLEITGGGTFTRAIGAGAGGINWSGLDNLGASISQERGSGGFAAFGANATVDLTPAAGTLLSWEDKGFVNSGHALLLGSTRADAQVNWVNDIGLTAVGQVTNYNAREFNVVDNPNSGADRALLSGVVSGTVQNDLLKTGNGTLVLGNAANTFTGATLVHAGTLLVNGSTASSFLTDVRTGATLGGSGTVGAINVENGGMIAPGNVLGNTSILNSGDLNFGGAAAKLTIELGGLVAGGNNALGYDQLNVVGKVSLSGATLQGSLLNAFLADSTGLFVIINNDGADAVEGSFAQGTSVTFGTQTFDISYTGEAGSNSFTGGNDVVLRLAVPEPGSALLLVSGLAGFALRRRRGR